MGNLTVVRRPQRPALYLPMGQTKKDPSIVIPFYKIDRSELNDIVRLELAKQGITDEPTVQAVIEEAEVQYEQRVKTEETRKELRRLMQLKKEGATLISAGYKKWKAGQKTAMYRQLKKGGRNE